ncbi:hypothetical protein WJX74_009248 [Apatococcus lobatus]|uniref:RRM domain-containing protein n=1 Tax=Apatococcus lobatus TaxID=904363 RepID=A0AAW1QZL2_9CHLO
MLRLGAARRLINQCNPVICSVNPGTQLQQRPWSAGPEDQQPRFDPNFAAIAAAWPVCITNLNRRVLRKDVHEFLCSNGCQVDPKHIRVEFSASLQPAAWWASLPTAKDQHKACELSGSYLGTRRVKIHKASPVSMREAALNPLAMHSRGRFVYMTGVQANVSVEDIKRFLQGFDMMVHPITMLRSRLPNGHIAPPQGTPIYTPESGRVEALSRAILRFTSAEEAQRAVREKSGEPLLNNRALLRVLE